MAVEGLIIQGPTFLYVWQRNSDRGDVQGEYAQVTTDFLAMLCSGERVSFPDDGRVFELAAPAMTAGEPIVQNVRSRGVALGPGTTLCVMEPREGVERTGIGFTSYVSRRRWDFDGQEVIESDTPFEWVEDDLYMQLVAATREGSE